MPSTIADTELDTPAQQVWLRCALRMLCMPAVMRVRALPAHLRWRLAVRLHRCSHQPSQQACGQGADAAGAMDLDEHLQVGSRGCSCACWRLAAHTLTHCPCVVPAMRQLGLRAPARMHVSQLIPTRTCDALPPAHTQGGPSTPPTLAPAPAGGPAASSAATAAGPAGRALLVGKGAWQQRMHAQHGAAWMWRALFNLPAIEGLARGKRRRSSPMLSFGGSLSTDGFTACVRFQKEGGARAGKSQRAKVRQRCEKQQQEGTWERVQHQLRSLVGEQLAAAGLKGRSTCMSKSRGPLDFDMHVYVRDGGVLRVLRPPPPSDGGYFWFTSVDPGANTTLSCVTCFHGPSGADRGGKHSYLLQSRVYACACGFTAAAAYLHRRLRRAVDLADVQANLAARMALLKEARLCMGAWVCGSRASARGARCGWRAGMMSCGCSSTARGRRWTGGIRSAALQSSAVAARATWCVIGTLAPHVALAPRPWCACVTVT